MTRLALTALYRSTTRHKSHAALNLVGLAIGIAAFLVLALYVRLETGFERWIPGFRSVYLVQTVRKDSAAPFSGVDLLTMGGLLDELRTDFPGLTGTRIEQPDEAATLLVGGTADKERIGWVDPDFLDLFPLRMRRTTGPLLLRDPNTILISASAATRLFGRNDPLGRSISVRNGTALELFRVAGVFEDLPGDTEFRFELLARIPRNLQDESWTFWGSSAVSTYLRFDTPEAARRFEAALPAFIDRHAADALGPGASRQIGLRLIPIARVHLGGGTQDSATRASIVTTLGLVGLLTLAMAIVNYVNLATARAELRAREVAIRKVVGASNGTLFRQFVAEAVIVVGCASLVGLALAEPALPIINAAGGLSLTMPYATVLPALVLLTLVVGPLAGFYPAAILSSYPVAAVLASARGGFGKGRLHLREALVVLQFGFAIAAMILTAVLFSQMTYLRTADLGFDRKNLLIIPSFAAAELDDAQRGSLLEELRALPNVVSATTSDLSVGGRGIRSSDLIRRPGRAAGVSLQRITVGPDFFRTFRSRLAAGRLFDAAHHLDDSAGLAWAQARNIVITRRAASALGFASPAAAIGQIVGVDAPRTIIGVVDDMRLLSPRIPLDGSYLLFTSRLPARPVLTLRYAGTGEPVRLAVRDLWQRAAPQIPFEASTAAQELRRSYAADDRAARLFAIGTGLAIVIGCIGLWGMSSFSTARRVKEVGIRKALGASTADVVRLLVGRFLRPVWIAMLLAWPLAYLAARAWLAGFDDRIALTPLPFAGASAAALAIAAATVSWQSYQAARTPPARALRHD